MLKFIGKALAGMVLTKEAQQAAGNLAQTAIKNAMKKPAADPELRAIVEMQEPVAVPSATPLAVIFPTNRAELIRHAMQIRAAKQSLLAELSEDDRAKLVAAAMRAFLHESKPKE